MERQPIGIGLKEVVSAVIDDIVPLATKLGRSRVKGGPHGVSPKSLIAREDGAIGLSDPYRTR